MKKCAALCQSIETIAVTRIRKQNRSFYYESKSINQEAQCRLQDCTSQRALVCNQQEGSQDEDASRISALT